MNVMMKIITIISIHIRIHIHIHTGTTIMKILLIQAPTEDFYDTDIRLMPLGLAYLKAALVKWFSPSEVECKILDFHQGHGKQNIPLPKELSYLRRYYCAPDLSPFCTFFQYYRFGASDESMIAAILAEKADAVGISAMFSPYFHSIASFIPKLKKAAPHLKIVVGGAFASSCPEVVKKVVGVDKVIVGEGEKELVEWVASEFQIPTLPNFPTHFDFETFAPIPDFSDFPLYRYSFEKKPMAFIMTSRGCPHACSFCTVHDTFGRNYRVRSLQSIKEEITLRVKQGYRVFDFEDDNLTFKQEQFLALMDWMSESFKDEKLTLLAMNGISSLSLNETLLIAMKKAGFHTLNLSLVSSDTHTTQGTKRPHTLEHFKKIVRLAYDLGFQMTCYQILGPPQESLESMLQTLKELSELPVLIGASPYYRPPNPKYLKNPRDSIADRLTALGLEKTEHFHRDDIYTLFVLTRMINFIKRKKGQASTATGSREEIGKKQVHEFLVENKNLCYINKNKKEGALALPHFNNDLARRFFSNRTFAIDTNFTI
jgi:radical SAM superfamily enzyme YgiQ (UPF0313 family)